MSIQIKLHIDANLDKEIILNGIYKKSNGNGVYDN